MTNKKSCSCDMLNCITWHCSIFVLIFVTIIMTVICCECYCGGVLCTLRILDITRDGIYSSGSVSFLSSVSF